MKYSEVPEVASQSTLVERLVAQFAPQHHQLLHVGHFELRTDNLDSKDARP